MNEQPPAWSCSRCREEIEAGFDACWNCGADRDGRPDPGFRRADEPDPPPPPSAGVANVCPACGGTEYRTTRPAGWIAYAPDRRCAGCGTRYTPPTPRWAAIVFLLVGTVIVLGTVASLVVYLLMGNVLGLPAAVVDVLFGLLGVAAIGHGLRSLRGQSGT